MIIPVSQVKKLREMTGAGMMDCKTALYEADGQIERAVDWLRKKGIAKADRKTGRATSQGLICITSKDTAAVIIEINSETDFVARNKIFQNLVRNIALVALETNGSLDQVTVAPYPGSNLSIAEKIKDTISNIGENLSLRRVSVLHVNMGVVATYIHNSIAEGLGKMGVIVAIETEGDKKNTLMFGQRIAMHIAASNPMVLSIPDLPPKIVEREKNIFLEQARQSGLSERILEKMVEGRMLKFYKEVVLDTQAFVMNPDLSVREFIKEAEKTVSAPMKITGFVRFALGEEIGKEQEVVAEQQVVPIKR